MKRKIHVLLFVLAMAVGMFGFANIKPAASNAVKASAANDLLSLLPASDAIIYVDAQKILNDTLPTFLANRQDLLAKIRKEINKANTEVGIDPNTIESAAVGISFKSKTGKDNTVVIVRGRFDSNATVEKGLARVEKDGKMKRHETVYEGRSIQFLKRISTTNNKNESVTASDNDTAVTVLDSNTIAVGDMVGVRTTIDASMGKNKVSDELVALATRNSSALVSFSGNTKAVEDLNLNFGKGGQLFEGVNQFYGALWNSGADSLEGQLTLRTNTSERAGELSDALNGFKTLFSGFGSKDPEAAMIKDILKGITIEAVGNEVDVKGKLSSSSISLIVGKF